MIKTNSHKNIAIGLFIFSTIIFMLTSAIFYMAYSSASNDLEVLKQICEIQQAAVQIPVADAISYDPDLFHWHNNIP